MTEIKKEDFIKIIPNLENYTFKLTKGSYIKDDLIQDTYLDFHKYSLGKTFDTEVEKDKYVISSCIRIITFKYRGLFNKNKPSFNKYVKTTDKSLDIQSKGYSNNIGEYYLLKEDLNRIINDCLNSLEYRYITYYMKVGDTAELSKLENKNIRSIQRVLKSARDKIEKLIDE